MDLSKVPYSGHDKLKFTWYEGFRFGTYPDTFESSCPYKVPNGGFRKAWLNGFFAGRSALNSYNTGSILTNDPKYSWLFSYKH